MDPDHVDADREAISSFYEAHPLSFDGTSRTISLGAWLYDMELIFRTSHIPGRLKVSLGSRCLTGDARIWWMAVGEPQLPSRTWGHFRSLLIGRFGPILDYGPGAPQRDPDIYRDMYETRYHSYTLEWHAYPLETMAHYCARFQEAMLPHVSQDMVHPVLEALTVLWNGLPSRIRQHVPFPSPRMSVEHMIEDILRAEVHADAEPPVAVGGDHQAPVDDAGIAEPVYEVGPVPLEEPIPAVPEQAVPAHEAEEPADAQGDPEAGDPDEDDVMIIPGDPPVDPIIIDISSDEEDDIEEMPADLPTDPIAIDISSDEEGDDEAMEQAGWFEDQEDLYLVDDPEEILFDDGDWETDSDIAP
ncbi:hypothetical protein TIFTF001_047179 [Ficus carica]|uniref:Retrotransposon gag domain-containing protein n=1 Tax=Ficus carica TaxID=3494 RepID=A0AA87YR14_FICCA|nr:hypothetical protein TIFTF001_047177 [Ficus carica]GMN20831.1 hypothetical protein TIFTF001_047179 [Ficus carica]